MGGREINSQHVNLNDPKQSLQLEVAIGLAQKGHNSTLGL